MGDIVSLVEKASEDLDQENLKKTEEKLKKGQFSMEDYLSQLRQMKKESEKKLLNYLITRKVLKRVS